MENHEDKESRLWWYFYLYGTNIGISLLMLVFTCSRTLPFSYFIALLTILFLYLAYCCLNHIIVKKYISKECLIIYETLLAICIVVYVFAKYVWWEHMRNSLILSLIMDVLDYVCWIPLELVMMID